MCESIYYIPLAQNIKTGELFTVKHLTSDKQEKDYQKYTKRTKIDKQYFSSKNRANLSYEVFFADFKSKANWGEYEYGFLIIDERSKTELFVPTLPSGEWCGENVEGFSRIKE